MHKYQYEMKNKYAYNNYIYRFIMVGYCVHAKVNCTFCLKWRIKEAYKTGT